MHSRETIHRTKNNLHANLNGNRYGLRDKSSSTHFICKQLNHAIEEKNKTRQCLISDREMITWQLETIATIGKNKGGSHML